MPYTTVVSGTVITASWANASVRDQTVVPFATTGARDSAITSPVEGMLTYISASDSYTFYNGSVWNDLLANVPVTAVQAADKSVTSSTTQTTTDLSIPVSAGQYTIRGVIWYTANEGGDFAAGVTVPASSSYRITASGLPGNLTTPNSAGIMYVGQMSSSPFGAWSGDNTGAILTGWLDGSINVTTSGSVALTFAQGISNGTATVLKAKSFMTLTRI